MPFVLQKQVGESQKVRILQKLPLPQFPWDSITMDFITKLPPSEDPATHEAYDAIMVVLDRHTKYTTIIPFKETYNTVQLAYVFLDRVVRVLGYLEKLSRTEINCSRLPSGKPCLLNRE